MLHFNDIAFGPIFSRRLGSSLGVNILPAEGKLCNFDCIYCECGWNRDGMAANRRFPGCTEVRDALSAKLEQCAADGTAIDSITFSGNGEPTLNPEFPQITDVAVELRDRYYPEAKISVLSNATMIDREEVFEALRKTDNPILKIDAPYYDGIASVNRPSPGYSLEKVIAGLKRFNGNFILQTMFLRSPEYDSSEEDNLKRWMDIVRYLSPREVMVYTIDRETPEKDLVKFTAGQMTEMVRPLVEEGFHIQVRGEQMRVVIQRVKHASVSVRDAGYEASIAAGLLVLVAFTDGDGIADLEWMTRKIVSLRVFDDDNGVMNLPVTDTGGDIMAISQFTLYASTARGNRPSYIRAARPETASPMYDEFCRMLGERLSRPVVKGIFGADMQVSLQNDGPVTIIIDSKIKE